MMDPDVPVTVMLEEPGGVEGVVDRVSVVVQVGLHDAGEKVAVAPRGRPEAVKETACVEPDERVEVMVFVTLDPWVTDWLPELVREKSKVGAEAVTVSVKDVV